MSRESGKFVHRNLPLMLLQARERVLSRFRPVLNSHGVTEQQWRIIRALHERGNLEPNQICEVCQISSPSLAGVLARMESLGMIEKSRHANDGRRVSVTLSNSSKALVRAMAPDIEANYRALESLLGRDLIERCYEMLDELLVALGPNAEDGSGS